MADHVRIPALALHRVCILFFNKAVICILCQVYAHDQGIGCTDRSPQRAVLDELLALLLLFHALYISDIREHGLNHLQPVRIDDPAHDHAEPYRLSVPAGSLADVGSILPVQGKAVDQPHDPRPVLIPYQLHRTFHLGAVLLLGPVSIEFPHHPVYVDHPVAGIRGKLDNAAGHGIIELAQEIRLLLIFLFPAL